MKNLLLYLFLGFSSLTVGAQPLTIKDLTSGSYAPKQVKISDVLPGEKDKARLKATEREQIYRRSYKACFTYDDKPIANGEKIEQPLVSPDGNNIAYVKDNNLFIDNTPPPFEAVFIILYNCFKCQYDAIKDRAKNTYITLNYYS